MKKTVCTALAIALLAFVPQLVPTALAAGGKYKDTSSPRTTGPSKAKSTASSATASRPKTQARRPASQRVSAKDFPANAAAKSRRASTGTSTMGAAGTSGSSGSGTHPTAAGWGTAKPRADQSTASVQRQSVSGASINMRAQSSR